MKKILFVLISILTLNTTVEACKCQKHDNSFMYLLESKHVFLGTVMSTKACGDNNKFEYQFFIDDSYKGELNVKETLYSDCVTSCSFQLEKGQRYLIFSDLNKKNIGFCDYIIPFSDTSFAVIKSYLDEIAYARLEYLELFETIDKSGYKAKLTVLNGKIRGVVNLFDNEGNHILQGVMRDGKMQGYYEIRKFGEEQEEVWTGNYKNGKRVGDWVCKAIPKGGSKKEDQYILYQYKAGEIIKVSNLSVKAQLEEYEPKKDDNEQKE
ncbi:MAG: hypothetical protein AB8G11_20605 [Saprospiraceae bacterium]